MPSAMYHDERGSSQAQTLLWRLSIAATVCRHHRLRRRAQERGAGTERNLGSSAKRAVRLEQSDSTAHCRRHRCRFCAAESSWHGQASSSGTLVRANISHGASRQLTRPHQRTQPRVRAMAAAHCFVRGTQKFLRRDRGVNCGKISDFVKSNAKRKLEQARYCADSVHRPIYGRVGGDDTVPRPEVLGMTHRLGARSRAARRPRRAGAGRRLSAAERRAQAGAAERRPGARAAPAPRRPRASQVCRGRRRGRRPSAAPCPAPRA